MLVAHEENAKAQNTCTKIAKKKKKWKKNKLLTAENAIRFKGRQKQHITSNEIRIIF